MAMEDLSGKWLKAKPLSCAANCMFSTLTCGTWKCFPSSFSGKFEIGSDGLLRVVDNYYCCCLRPSPIPCFMCCGVGPCAQQQVMKKESETKWVGTGDSLLAGGCCKGMCHNNGDVMTVSTENGETVVTWKAGTSQAYPPCFQGKEVVSFTKASWNKGGAPQATEMER